MPRVSEYRDELSLLWCVLLNAAVCAAAFRFARRRMTRNSTQAVLDAALLAYAVQYASVCLPGVLGALGPGTITATALLLSALLWARSGGGTIDTRDDQPASPRSRWIVLIVWLFVIGYVLAFVHTQHILPVMSNDALTYHFPAAVQWLQSGRLGLFPTWFFNPANTYSPLAGSAFIAWLLAPFNNDVLARFVELPALLGIGLAVFLLGRLLRVELVPAGLVAAAVVVARPMLFPAIMGKDDLFVTLFFACALIGMTPARATEPLAALRMGVALGLLLATKYTAVFTLPILLLAIDGPWHAGRRWRWWAAVIAPIVLLAGPWYFRNFWLTRNPLFPIDISIGGRHIFPGLFTPGRSAGLGTLDGVARVLTGGNYGLPVSLALVLGAVWLTLLIVRRHLVLRDPLLRVVALGPVIGVALFVWKSPFPEVRFVLPCFLLLFVAVAPVCEAIAKRSPIRSGIAAVVLGVAWWTAFGDKERTLEFGTAGILLAAVGLVAAWLAFRLPRRLRWAVVGGGAIAVGAGAAFVYWAGSVRTYEQSVFIAGSGWDLRYEQNRPLWKFIAEHMPRGSTLAYTNLYMVYPLQGMALDRRVVYAATREGVQSPADLAWLGERLAGEQLVPAVVRATLASPDRATWLQNLRRSSAEYLVIGKAGGVSDPPEIAFAEAEAKRFRKLFENEAGMVYAIDRSVGE